VALTITTPVSSVFGNKRVVIANVAFDNSYPTGGETLAASGLGLEVVDSILVSPHGTRVVTYEGGKLKVYTALTTEAGNTSDQSSVTATIMAIGH